VPSFSLSSSPVTESNTPLPIVELLFCVEVGAVGGIGDEGVDEEVEAVGIVGTGVVGLVVDGVLLPLVGRVLYLPRLVLEPFIFHPQK